MDGEIGVAGPVGLQLGVTYRRIFDGAYENVVGEFPSFTAFTAGIGFAFD